MQVSRIITRVLAGMRAALESKDHTA